MQWRRQACPESRLRWLVGHFRVQSGRTPRLTRAVCTNLWGWAEVTGTREASRSKIGVEGFSTLGEFALRRLASAKALHQDLFSQVLHSGEDFRFYEKRRKAKIAVSVGFAASSEGGATKLLPWEPRSASQPSAAGAWSGVCEHLSFVWGSSKRFPYKLMVIAS